MGQSTSSSNNNNKKKFGSTVFGYTASTQQAPSPIYIQQSEIKHDNVLLKPFLYGLHSTLSMETSIDEQDKDNNSRADSGFLLNAKDCQLWKDLIYIDDVYYSDTQQAKSREEEVDQLVVGNALTFKDIATSVDLQEINLSKKDFGYLSPNIGLLSSIRKLELSHNQLKELPEAIGHLNQLEHLSVAHNQITRIPDSISHLSQLTEFNLSHNQITELTPFISCLTNLQTLQLGHNQLQELNFSIDSLSNLIVLDLSYNSISIVPAEITRLPFLRRLRLDGCPFQTNSPLDQPLSLAHNPPSLLETCARLVVKNEHAVLSSLMTKYNKRKSMTAKEPESTITLLRSVISDPLYDYLSSFKTCSHCHGPYFESCVKRGRWIERNDIWIPLEYRLCSAHWSDESDRMYSMFSSSTQTLSSTATTTKSLFKLKPELEPLRQIMNRSPSTTRRSRFHKKQRSSNTTPIDTEALTVIQNQPGWTDEESSSSSSVAKGWRFKVRNNSSLFLKNHRL